MHYNHQYYGDTTETAQFTIHQLTALPVQRYNPLLTCAILNCQFFNYNQGFFNSSNVPFDPTPIGSYTAKFSPHKDSIFFKLPNSLGAKWFDRAQKEERIIRSGGQVPIDSAYFSSPTNFVVKYFNGLHIKASPSSGNVMVGFSAGTDSRGTSKMKVRIYYKKVVNDILTRTYFDFYLQYPATQFQNIKYDRSSTPHLSSLQPRQGNFVLSDRQ